MTCHSRHSSTSSLRDSRPHFFRRNIQSFDMQGAEPLIAFHLLVLDLLAIFQRTEAISLDAGVVNKYILPFGIDDEAESLLHVEPLDRANQHRFLDRKST